MSYKAPWRERSLGMKLLQACGLVCLIACFASLAVYFVIFFSASWTKDAMHAHEIHGRHGGSASYLGDAQYRIYSVITYVAAGFFLGVMATAKAIEWLDRREAKRRGEAA